MLSRIENALDADWPLPFETLETERRRCDALVSRTSQAQPFRDGLSTRSGI